MLRPLSLEWTMNMNKEYIGQDKRKSIATKEIEIWYNTYDGFFSVFHISIMLSQKVKMGLGGNGEGER